MTVAGLRRTEPVVYPSTDHRGEHEYQRLISELLRPLVERLMRERELVAHVGADTFIYWVEGNTSKTIAPDVYVLPDVDQGLQVGSWKLWEIDTAPSFALEIAGDDIDKDYVDDPKLYAEMGCG